MEKVKTKSNKCKKLIVIAVAIALFAFVGIGYAIYSQTISIKGKGTIGGGTFALAITSVTPAEGNTATGSSDFNAENKNTDITFTVNAGVPGDTYTATITVTNNGTLAAKYTGIDAATTNPTDQYITCTLTTTTADNTEIAASGTQTFTFTFTWDSADTTQHATATTYNFAFTINYEQA